jgi:hypothetical protein
MMMFDNLIQVPDPLSLMRMYEPGGRDIFRN